jgi:hypothetical protein
VVHTEGFERRRRRWEEKRERGAADALFAGGLGDADARGRDELELWGARVWE